MDIKQIKEFLAKEYDEEFILNFKSEQVYEYIDEDDAEEYEGDYEEAYDNLCTGNAIEYDLMQKMHEDIKNKFGVDIYKAGFDRSDHKEINDFMESRVALGFPSFGSPDPFEKMREGYQNIMKSLNDNYGD